MEVFKDRVCKVRQTRGIRISCVIDKERYIYDREMPHMSYEIEEVKEGDRVNAMIVENCLYSKYDFPSLKLTIQNSKIIGCKQ